ncbi:MAG: ATP-binding protein [Bacillota bacterium]|nr:ATP-binding protein [Bacillota bacterium]
MNIEEIAKIPALEPENNDYIGDDGLLHCSICHEPKETYYPLALQRPGWEKHPSECRCQREKREAEEKEYRNYLHRSKVKDLKGKCFPSKTLDNWTFDNCILDEKKISFGKKYVSNWNEIESGNHGLLLWGPVGTGKSYFAACIANELIEQEIPVRMTNLSAVMNCSFDEREDLINGLCKARLLIIDDFGMERDTSYGMETVFQIINRRYVQQKPLMLTTNLSLKTLEHPSDLEHQRIYDRVLEITVPVAFLGNSLRTNISKDKKKKLDEILNG